MFLNRIRDLSRLIFIIAGTSVMFIMFLTVADVILRYFRRPILGAYELVAFSGAIATGFSLPFTSWVKGHISVDFLISRFPQRIRNTFNIVTRCLVIGLFLITGWNLIQYGMDLKRAGEVSLTLQIPFYPIAYGIGGCCFVLCLVLICDIIKIFRGEYE
jgi:TRAP-type C4-dicarboxylate transport system permease small subunit